MTPSSMSLRQVWSPPPRKVSGAPPTSSFLRFARASIFLPSSRKMATGFSLWTLLPALSAASATLAWAFGMVRFTTISISGSARSSSTVQAFGTLNCSAFARACSGTMSAQATTSRISNVLIIRSK